MAILLQSDDKSQFGVHSVLHNGKSGSDEGRELLPDVCL